MSSERKGRWIPILYYYIATTVGLVLMLIGATGALQGARKALVPESSDEVVYGREFAPPRPVGEPGEQETPKQIDQTKRNAIEAARERGVGQSLDGLTRFIVATPVFWWHLRQARRKEPEWLGVEGG